MSRKYNKTFTSLKTVVHDTSILDAQKILVKVPDNSFEERTDIIDYINVSNENIKTEINESINNANENIDTINTILGNKIFESSEKSTATTLIDWDAIHYKDTTTVPHNTDIVLITLIPQNTNISVKTYLAAWYVNSSDEKTWLGMSDNAITWEEGKKATWTFLNNPLNIPDNCRLELFLTTSILNNPSSDPSHPGVYFASNASDNKQATHRYDNYWDRYGGTPYTIFNSSSLISNEEATNKFADKAITEKILGETGYIYELAADATEDGECDAIHYAANKIPHNIVIDEIRIPTLNNSPKPLYLAVWIINQSDVKTYIGLSDSTATWSEGETAIWKFTNNPITVPENYKLELFLAETAPASGTNSTPVSSNYIKTYVNYSGSGTVRRGGTWYSGRDIRTIFVKNGIVVNHEDRISILEEKTPEGVAKVNEANTFTATNTFNGSTVFNGASRFQTGPYDITINERGLWSYYPITSDMGFVTQGALSVAPLGITTALGADAYALKVSKTEGIQLWGTHFMQGDEWSENALKIVHNELALFGNHQAPCSLTFDNANVINFRVMPDDGSTANGGQGAIFDFQGWQWDNDSHTSKNANCPVQILKNNAGTLTERSLLNKAELDENYIIANEDNKHIVDTLNDTISATDEYATGWVNLETNTYTWSFWIDSYGPYQILKNNPMAQDWCDLINAQNIPYEATPHETDNTIFYIKAKNPGSTYCVPFGLGPEIGRRDESQIIYSGLTLSHGNINLKKIDFLSEAQSRFAQRNADNTFSANNTFKSGLTSESDVLISNGVLTFEDLVDGTVVERSGASGYQYIEGMPTSFENGVCYDIGEISNTTNLTNVKFTGEGRLVQTCELWFKTPATVPTTHKWPYGNDLYWIDSATGAAPTLIASKNYRIVLRREPKKVIASLAYIY